jgi:two-component system KDP operon response regulator KdpE
LTPTEYDILRALARKGGKVMTHPQLMREVWGHLEQDLHTLRVNISNLRRKIEPDPSRPRLLVTEPGVGYRFQLLTEEEMREDPVATD